ncbi:MAG: hypothetical protein IJD04_02470 [Desulfovibrionaceae bacterium]|nr:hypothetical protein [Desulfovibrionaceae bacterium]
MNEQNNFQITVIFEPENYSRLLPRPRSVTQLLNRLKLKPCEVLVIRNGGLLTPDREILPGETITLRSVVSRG